MTGDPRPQTSRDDVRAYDHDQQDPVLTVFRSRLRPDAADEYSDAAQRMLELAKSMPGFVDFKMFEAPDGERVSLITFSSLDAQRAWREHPEHREAQALGRARFYEWYSIAVCRVRNRSEFRR